MLSDNNIEYEEFYSPAEDYRLWARLMDVTHFYNIQDVLVKYRCFGDNTSEHLKFKAFVAWKNIRTQLMNKYPALYKEYMARDNLNTRYYVRRSFGFIPLLKVKHNMIYLFEFIPLLKLNKRTIQNDHSIL